MISMARIAIEQKWNIDYDSGFNSGMEFERNRIIRLLEENSAKDPDCNCNTCEDERFLIALIKGEQK